MRIGKAAALTGSCCYYCNLLLAASALRPRAAGTGFISPRAARARGIGIGTGSCSSGSHRRAALANIPPHHSLDGRGFGGGASCRVGTAISASSSAVFGGGGGRNATVLAEAASTAEVTKDSITAPSRRMMTGDDRSSPLRRPSAMYVASRNGAEMPWGVDVHGRSASSATGSGSSRHATSTTSSSVEAGSSGAMMSNVADEGGGLGRGGVVRGEDGVHPTPLDATSLLKLLPRGAYTTCRTVDGGTKVYQFEYHANRLAESAKEMIDDEGIGVDNFGVSGGDDVGKEEDGETKTTTRSIAIDPDVYGAVTDYARVRDAMLSTVRSTVDAFRRRYGDRLSPRDEFRVTLLSTWLPPDQDAEAPASSHEANLYCHVGVLPVRREGERIRVEVHGRGRSHAAAKDSKWVSERENSSEVRDDVEEFVLVDDHGHMLEGTQTNFYLVGKDGAVITAEDGILRGSVRDSVLRVCADPGDDDDDDGATTMIPVELRPPTMDDLRDARGAFLTSTSRMVMPVHEVVVNVTRDDVGGDDDGGSDGGDGSTAVLKTEVPEGATYRFHDCDVTERIRRLVLEDVKTHCVSIE